jgi:DNA polymerase III subunit gamma/tau
MSYEALARKWRPRQFQELVGQGHVVRALTHALEQDKLHHALLFSGTRGVGKTTIARILARCLNCEKGVSASPCGECSSCKEIDQGRFVDLIEIDAASNTGVDNVRDLQDNIVYAPTRGRRKVYLIDEVHMFSKGAFNALLKTLEEPPPRVHFILATTDPQKLPVTILSRCLQFHLKRLPAQEIRNQLKSVLEQEGVSFEPAALVGLAHAADGSMRDGLSLLDQAIAFGGGQVREAEVRDMLGSLSRRDILALIQALSEGDGAALLAALAALDEKAPDYDAVLADLSAVLQRIALIQLVPDAELADEEAAEELLRLAQQMTAEDTQLYYQIALQGRRDIDWAPDPRSGLEMTLLRMLAFRPDGGGQTTTSTPGNTPGHRPTTSGRGQKPADPRAAAAGGGSGNWEATLAQLELRGPVTELARNCAWLGREGDVVSLRLDPRHESLLVNGLEQRLEAALQKLWGPGTCLKLKVESGDQETPAQSDDRRRDALHSGAEQAIAEDPVVQGLQSRFGARVRPGSVEPLE